MRARQKEGRRTLTIVVKTPRRMVVMSLVLMVIVRAGVVDVATARAAAAVRVGAVDAVTARAGAVDAVTVLAVSVFAVAVVDKTDPSSALSPVIPQRPGLRTGTRRGVHAYRILGRS